MRGEEEGEGKKMMGGFTCLLLMLGIEEKGGE